MERFSFIMILLFVFSCNKNLKEASGKFSNQTGTITEIPSMSFNDFQTYLKNDNDTTYVVNFWATWCKPCVKELPAFERINEEFKKNKVKVTLVSLDFPKQMESHVIPFLEKNNIQSEVVLLDDTDANTWIPKVDTTWSGAIPATIIYNSSNWKFFERSFTYEELKNEITTLLL